MKTRRIWAAASVVLLCAGVLSQVIGETRWRTRLIVVKAAGQLPDLSWKEIIWLLPPGSGVYLQPVLVSRNPYTSLINRHTSPADIEAGGELFLERCAACHGANAEGATGPDLTAGHFRQGWADWSLFRTIRWGLPDTAMKPHDLPPVAIWQLVSFVKHTVQAAGLSAMPADGSATETVPVPEVTFDELVRARSGSSGWLMYSGSYDGQRHSRLTGITRDNVAQLAVKWLFHLPTDLTIVENTPLVVGDTMFVSLPPGDVWAIDARTGERLWTYRGAPSPRGLRLSVEPVNRGLAILGRTLYVARIDAVLVALDATTGKELWTTRVADFRDGYSMTSAPLALEHAILVGVGGGELGIRGYIDAYSPVDGTRIWRFHTVPGPGEPGHDSWGGGTSWQRGGAPTWLTGSYDPTLDLVYWGVGNPAPDFQGDVRPGDNLYSNSVVALESRTGRLRWHFQFTPHDEHDWDAAQIPVLADAVYDGQPRRLMYWANRNGFYYVLDRETGQFLHARPFVKQTWAERIDSSGRPIENALARPTRQGTMVSPSVTGATNWWSPAYDPGSNTFFVPAMEGPGVFTKSMELTTPDGFFSGSSARPGSGADLLVQAVRALDAATGELKWERQFSGRPRMGGLLSTAGGLVFGSDRSRFFALDSRDGRELWHLNVGEAVNAAPIAYLSDGQQQVTILAGPTIVTLALTPR